MKISDTKPCTGGKKIQNPKASQACLLVFITSIQSKIRKNPWNSEGRMAWRGHGGGSSVPKHFAKAGNSPGHNS